MRQRCMAALVAAALLAMCLLSGCGQSADKMVSTPTDGMVKVYASVYPVYDFTKKIGGDRIQLTCMVPAGAEPHAWEPSPRSLAGLQEADLFIYNGAGMEPWVDKVAGALADRGPEMVVATTGIELSTLEPATHEHVEKGHGHHHTGYDPHVWLDPVLARTMAQNITRALVEVDPGNREYYESNCQVFVRQLKELDTDYREALDQCQRHQLVVTHQAFGYLARRYNLEQVPLMGISAESEPTPTRLAEVARFCQEHDVTYIFVEKLVSPKAAQALAREIGAEVLVLDPIGGLTSEQIQKGDDYLSLMKANLENLKKALEYRP